MVCLIGDEQWLRKQANFPNGNALALNFEKAEALLGQGQKVDALFVDARLENGEELHQVANQVIQLRRFHKGRVVVYCHRDQYPVFRQFGEAIPIDGPYRSFNQRA